MKPITFPCFIVSLRRFLFVLAVPMSLASCAGYITPKDDVQPLLKSTAIRMPASETNKILRTLPLPPGKIEAAVYSFSDLTGQKKDPPNSSTLSSAVTQGAETILIKALLESRWFSPKERKGLQNVLTERKILQSQIDERNNGNRVERIKSLSPAKIIIEGGVVGYDSNVRSGGIGAKYLGLGSSTRYREDLVSVNLRAVNVIDGSIMHSVNSYKSLYSKIKDTGVFAYLTYNQILEFETGYSFNESTQISLTEAIESAVVQLIADGVLKKLWRTRNVEDVDHPSFEKYADPTLWHIHTVTNKVVER